MIEKVNYSNKDYNKLISLIIKLPKSPSVEKFEQRVLQNIKTPHHLIESNSTQDNKTSYTMDKGFGSSPLKKKKLVENNMNYLSKKEYFNINLMKKIINEKGVSEDIFIQTKSKKYFNPANKSNSNNNITSGIFAKGLKNDNLDKNLNERYYNESQIAFEHNNKNNKHNNLSNSNANLFNKNEETSSKNMNSPNKLLLSPKTSKLKLSDMEFQLSREVLRVSESKDLGLVRNNRSTFLKSGLSQVKTGSVSGGFKSPISRPFSTRSKRPINFNFSPKSAKNNSVKMTFTGKDPKLTILKVQKTKQKQK